MSEFQRGLNLRVFTLFLIQFGLLSGHLFGNSCSLGRPYCSLCILTTCYLVPDLAYLLFAHLSRRLTAELIGYPWIRRPSSSSVRSYLYIFSSETAWPIKAKFYVEPPWEGGTKVCINGPGHMTKMAATPIYGKNPSKIFFSESKGPISTKLGM